MSYVALSLFLTSIPVVVISAIYFGIKDYQNLPKNIWNKQQNIQLDNKKLNAKNPIENKIFFDKLINGDLGLAKTFWIYNILVNIVLAIIYQVDLINANTTVFWIIKILHIIYYTIVLLGIWIASNKYKGKQYWAILAKVYVVVQLLFALFVMVNILNTVT